jgi:hypothetical protein
MNYERKPLQFTVANRSQHMAIALGHGIAAIIQLELLTLKYEVDAISKITDLSQMTSLLKTVDAASETTCTVFNSMMSGYVALVVGSIVDCDEFRRHLQTIKLKFDTEIKPALKPKPEMLEFALKRSAHYYASADLILSKSFDTFAFPDLETKVNITLGGKA